MLKDGTTRESLIRLSEREMLHREELMAWIEEYTLTLNSVPYHLISTEDLERILKAIETNWK